MQKLRAVATDGRRLALAEMPASDGLAGTPGVIIPRKTVAEVRRLLVDPDEPVASQVSGQKVRFTVGEATVTSKVVDGAFVAYERYIPWQNRRVMTVDAARFAAAVRRVATISDELSRPVKLSVEAMVVTLQVRNMGIGHPVDALDVDYQGEPFEVGFNARYVQDVMAQMGGETAEFPPLRKTLAAPRTLDAALVLDPADGGVQPC